MQTALYFDAVNFASRIKVPSLVAMGFVDTVTPPVGIWIAFNQIQGPKRRSRWWSRRTTTWRRRPSSGLSPSARRSGSTRSFAAARSNPIRVPTSGKAPRRPAGARADQNSRSRMRSC